MLPVTKREGAGAPPEPVRFEPVPGAVVGEKYRIERKLGEGGMGVVVAATHLALDQPVAIKFLLPEATRSKVAVERFQREARVAAKVRSEHVARVHDVGTVEGAVPYIVMEQLVGRDLGRTIAESGALPVEDACEIALQACEALGEVHAAGIVHRDLKPSNLFVTQRADGSPAVKLLDFGISKLTLDAEDTSVDPALTATTTIMGSPSYMSPEQLKSTKEVDPRTDVWSLGAVLYEALTGKPAFRGESVPQVCAMIASEEPRPPSAQRDDIPAELEQAVLGCLTKDAERRIALVDLAHVLARFAPDRARPSLERLEALVGGSARSSAPRLRTEEAAQPSASARDRLRNEEGAAKERARSEEGAAKERMRVGAPSNEALPVLPLATADRQRTLSTWGRREARGGGAGGGRVAMVLIAVAGMVGLGVATGRVQVPRFPSDLAGAASFVSSAATAVSSALAPSASALANDPRRAGAAQPASSAPDNVSQHPGASSSGAPLGAPSSGGPPSLAPWGAPTSGTLPSSFSGPVAAADPGSSAIAPFGAAPSSAIAPVGAAPSASSVTAIAPRAGAPSTTADEEDDEAEEAEDAEAPAADAGHVAVAATASPHATPAKKHAPKKKHSAKHRRHT